MTGVKTNEREGTRAVLRHSRVSAYKVRQVLDLVRGLDVDRAEETLALGDREAAITVGKVLASAVANAVHNDGLDAEELYVSACYADEGSTIKRWRPRARGRATRIRKRTCHITIIVSRLPEDRIARAGARQAANSRSQRSRRVAGSRRRQRAESPPPDAASARPTSTTPEPRRGTRRPSRPTTWSPRPRRGPLEESDLDAEDEADGDDDDTDDLTPRPKPDRRRADLEADEDDDGRRGRRDRRRHDDGDAEEKGK